MRWLFTKIKNMAFQTHNCINATQTKKFNTQTVKSSLSDLWTSLLTCNEYAVGEGLVMCPGKTFTVLSQTTFFLDDCFENLSTVTSGCTCEVVSILHFMLYASLLGFEISALIWDWSDCYSLFNILSQWHTPFFVYSFKNIIIYNICHNPSKIKILNAGLSSSGFRHCI